MSASAHAHPDKAKAFQKDGEYAKWHDETLWYVRSKRDRASKTIPEWESLRTAASEIKAYTRSRLP
jgi:L-lactate dehydrogenase complex protein LldF